MSASDLPRPFGEYLLTASLAEDALGRVYRAIRITGEKAFVRLRILEGPDLPEDAVLDAIQEYGEIHTFLKNPAIARGVQMDAVDGTPFIAWNEETGRTLDALLEKARTTGQRIPTEHALLIAEKAASALEHAYNTTVDGERTLHGLVWPGFVCISDDGETRLTGFGLAPGVLPALDRPRLSAQVAPYIAPEARAAKKTGRNSDVYSVGALLFELLSGELPTGQDPAGNMRALPREEGDALTPEVIALLRSALAPADSRYQSPVELRRELGKLLFGGPYAPSTFNLAFFLNHAFAGEIEAETHAREGELRREPPHAPAGRSGAPVPAPKGPAPPAPRDKAIASPPAAAPRPRTPAGKSAPARRPVAVVVAALLIAAVAGTLYVLSRAPEAPSAVPLSRPAAVETPASTPTALPTPEATAPTVEMTDAQFKDEVSRRVAEEIRKLEDAIRKKEEKASAAAAAQETGSAPGAAAAEEPTPAPPPVLEAAAEPEPSPLPDPPPVATRDAAPPAGPAAGEPGAGAAEEAALVPPRIKRVVKPSYPPIALRQRIGGIVILRVLVSETGQPREVEVLRGVRGGLSDAAAAAVRRWTFEPATRNGEPVSAWTTVPIPFEP
jgi:protein TonB